MTRAELESAAAERYPVDFVMNEDGWEFDQAADERAAYIQGRLDQAEADAQIAEADTAWSIMGHPAFDQKRVMASSIGSERERIAAEIREGVE